jgi:Na+/phosphate symporter
MLCALLVHCSVKPRLERRAIVVGRGVLVLNIAMCVFMQVVNNYCASTIQSYQYCTTYYYQCLSEAWVASLVLQLSQLATRAVQTTTTIIINITCISNDR